LHHAIYLRADPVGTRVLSTDSAELPLGEPSSSEVIDFGDSSLLLVMSRRGELGGGFFPRLPWLVGAVTVAATVAGGDDDDPTGPASASCGGSGSRDPSSSLTSN